MTNTSQRRALVVQSNTPFGNKLIQSGYINPEQLQQAIKTARPGQPLTEILESITGQPLPPELARQYKKQQLFELRIVHGVEAYDPEIAGVNIIQMPQSGTDREQLDTWLNLQNNPNALQLLDPSGARMMQYPVSKDGPVFNKMRKDIEKLLKWNSTGKIGS